MKKQLKRWLIGFACVAGLVFVYLFQKLDPAGAISPGLTAIHKFLINRTIRFLLNDAFMIGLIYALFVEKKYVIFALWVQLAGVILFLIPYFVLKMYYPGYNGPMISYLHRLILNPTLLLLLIPAYYYQKKNAGKPPDQTSEI
jgi:exosortase F-associated protein